MLSNKVIGCLFLACLLMVSRTPALARSQQDATGFVRSVLDKAMSIQTNPGLEGTKHRSERAKLVRRLILENFQTSEMARESLKEHWARLSARQRGRYLPLFTAIFVGSYTRRVLDFLGKEKVEYPGDTPEGKYMKVRTVMMRPYEHIPVDYIVGQTGHRWMIRDVIIDGVSTVDTYQDAFDRFLRTHSFESLIQRMAIQEKAGG